MSDTYITPLAAMVLNCLCTQAALNPDPPQHCCYRVGQEIAHDTGQWEDLCCEGLAYVALGDIYPSSGSFPEQDIIRQANTVCKPPAWAVNFKLGIIRCVPTGDGFLPPSCTEWNTAAAQNIEDAKTLKRVACCIRDAVISADAFLGMSVVIERQTQGSPLGGCVERSFTIAVQVPNCDCEEF